MILKLEIHRGNIEIQTGYRFNQNSFVLNASFNQNNSLFGKAAGSQCTGVCGVAIVTAFMLNPIDWDVSIINNVLILGSAYYLVSYIILKILLNRKLYF